MTCNFVNICRFLTSICKNYKDVENFNMSAVNGLIEKFYDTFSRNNERI